jgi:hypothetical protein
VQTVWRVSPTIAVLLLLGALAIACASGLVAVIRWRAAVFALAVGGWLAAAIATAATPLVLHPALPGSDASGLVAYEPGYYVCLGGAAAIVLSGLWAAVLGQASSDRVSSASVEAEVGGGPHELSDPDQR